MRAKQSSSGLEKSCSTFSSSLIRIPRLQQISQITSSKSFMVSVF